MDNQTKPFREYLQEEVERVKESYYPARASFLMRVFVRHANCKKLHPNPEDEFCIPSIGPSDSIIAKYTEEYKRAKKDPDVARFQEFGIQEPLTVQKAMPDGFMLLNGHHRWAAAMRIGVKRVKIRIVNLTQEQDVHNMLRNSKSDKRVALDLDELVFGEEGDSRLEKPLRFPLNLFFKERIKLGIPALLHFLNAQGYDIWVYTSRYYSMEYIRYLFKHRDVRLTGIVTGTGRKGPWGSFIKGTLKKLLATKYRTTIHIDSGTVMRTFSGSKECEEYPLSGSEANWTREVMDIIGKLK